MALLAAPLVVFILVIAAVVASVVADKKVRIPCTLTSFKVEFWYPPLVGVLILLIEGSLSGHNLWIGGLAGSDGVNPYVIMIMFETLAYVCIAVDMTGILAYIAMRVVQSAGSSGKKLFFYFFALSSAFTVVTSNDIVILTLTPIIYYCCYVTKMNPMPLLFAEFFSANICSQVLLIGNPVNIIVATANNISFAGYSNVMVAPAIVGDLTCMGLIYLFFHKDINVTFSPPELNPAGALKDKRGAVFHVIILILTRVFLGIAPNIGAINWVVTAVPAVLCLIYNVIYWKWEHGTPNYSEVPSAIELSPQKFATNADMVTAPSKLDKFDGVVGDEEPTPLFIHVNKTPSTPSKEELSAKDFAASSEFALAVKEEQGKAAKAASPSPFDDTTMPTAKGSLAALPWAVIPFLFGMFTLVEGLKIGGWIDEFAKGVVSAIPADEGNSPHAVAIAAFLMAAVSCLLCNLINNQPASILLTRVVLAPSFASLPSKVKGAGMFGVIEGANVGANWTLIGALAGILWATILRNKGIVVTYFQFMRNGFLVMPLVTFMIALIIFLEHL